MTELLLERNDQPGHIAPEVRPVNGYVPTESEQRFAQQAVAENSGNVDHQDPAWVDHTAQVVEHVGSQTEQH